MSTTELNRVLTSAKLVVPLLVTAGAILIVASALWPHCFNGQEFWSAEQALELQRASAELHQLSNQYDEERTQGRSESLADELKHARARFSALNSKLDEAKRQPIRVALLLRVLGTALTVGGLAFFFRMRQLESST